MLNHLITCMLAFFGEPYKMNYVNALEIGENALLFMQKDCMSSNNDIMCKIRLKNVIEATEQIVQGKIYKIAFQTNSGVLNMQLWHQFMPKIVSLHELSLDEKNLLIDKIVKIPENIFTQALST